MAIGDQFNNPFFSLAGQKERLMNIPKTIIASVSGQGVTSNTGNKAFDSSLGFVASHPFATAGVATLGITAIGRTGVSAASSNIVKSPAIQKSLTSPNAIAKGASGLRNLGIAAGGGFLGALLLTGKDGAANAPQSQNQQPTMNSNPSQPSISYDYSTKTQDSYQYSYNQNLNSPGAEIGGNPTLTPTITGTTQSPYLSNPSSQNLDQGASQQASSGISTTMIVIAGLAVIAVAYFTGRKGGRK